MTTASREQIAPHDSLSAAMKAGSAVEHQEAEDSPFITNLLGGRVDAAGYVTYLQSLRGVYAALESTARDLATDPIVSVVFDRALERLDAIDSDLAFWTARAGGEVAPLESPAVDAYVARIAESADNGTFVAHHYTRYLGDLSGGQAIGRILDRTFDLDGQGVAFYSFEQIPAVKPYKDAYRANLDAIGDRLTPAERGRLVDEVKVAFRAHHDLFAELGRKHPGTAAD